MTKFRGDSSTRAAGATLPQASRSRPADAGATPAPRSTFIGVRECRACGCTDRNACIAPQGPCRWTLLDIATPTGVCSACAEEMDWHPLLLATAGIEEQPELLQAAGGLLR